MCRATGHVIHFCPARPITERLPECLERRLATGDAGPGGGPEISDPDSPNDQDLVEEERAPAPVSTAPVSPAADSNPPAPCTHRRLSEPGSRRLEPLSPRRPEGRSSPLAIPLLECQLRLEILAPARRLLGPRFRQRLCGLSKSATQNCTKRLAGKAKLDQNDKMRPWRTSSASKKTER